MTNAPRAPERHMKIHILTSIALFILGAALGFGTWQPILHWLTVQDEYPGTLYTTTMVSPLVLTASR